MTDSSALDRVWTVPNIISTARLFLALVLFVAIERELCQPALVLFLVAASTDSCWRSRLESRADTPVTESATSASAS